MNFKNFNTVQPLPRYQSQCPPEGCAPYNPFMIDMFGVDGGDGGTGNPLTPEYAAILDYAGTQGYSLPSDEVQQAQNNLITKLKEKGIWADLDVFYNFLGDGDQNFALINWKSPGSFSGLLVTDAFYTTLEGINNGTLINGGINTQWRSGVNGVNFTQNSHSFFVETGNAPTTGNYDLMGDRSGAPRALISGFGSGYVTTYSNPETASSVVIGKGAGLFHAQRFDASTLNIFKNGTSVISKPDPIGTGTLDAVNPMLIGAARGQGHANNTVFRMAGMGASLAGKESDLYNEWANYKVVLANLVYTPEYVAILQYATSQGYAVPTANVRNAQNHLIETLKADGIWDELDVFYNFLGDGDANFVKINWKNPGTFQAAGGTYTVNGGILGVCSTPFVPATDVVNSLLNNACLFADANVPNNGLDYFPAFGFIGASRNYNRLPKQASNTRYDFAVNSGDAFAASTGISEERFFAHQHRTASNVTSLYINGAFVINSGVLSVSLPGGSGTIAAANVTSFCFGAGASLVGREGNLYTAWQVYKSNLVASAAYKAITNYATAQGYTLPSAANQSMQEQLISKLVQAGIWDELDVFYNFLTDGDANFAKINWKNPGTLPATGAATFTPLQGFSGVLTTAYNPTTFTNPKFVTGNFSCFGYYDLYTPVNNTWGTASIGTGSFAIRDGATSYYYGGPVSSNPTPPGFMHNGGVGSVSRRFKDGVGFSISGVAGTVASSAISPLNSGGSCSCFGAGSALEGKESALYSAWNLYVGSTYAV